MLFEEHSVRSLERGLERDFEEQAVRHMADWPPLVGPDKTSTSGLSFSVANGGGVSVPDNATGNVKGAWTEISSSVPADVSGVWVTLTVKSSAVDQLIDIGTGSSGAERIVIPDIYYAAGSSSSYNKQYYFPLRLRKGVRLAARMQSPTAAAVTSRVSVSWHTDSWYAVPCFDRFVAYGAAAADTSGVDLGDPAANAWGAWTQIVASSDKLGWIMPIFGDRGLTTRTSGNRFLGQLGAGAASSEVAFGPEYAWSSSSTAFSINGFPGFYCRIRSGTRIAGRYSASTATSLGCDLVVYGGLMAS